MIKYPTVVLLVSRQVSVKLNAGSFSGDGNLYRNNAKSKWESSVRPKPYRGEHQWSAHQQSTAREKIKPTQKGSTTERERIARMMAYRTCECCSGAMRANIHCLIFLSFWTATVEWGQFNSHTNPFTPDGRKPSAHGSCRGDLSEHFFDALQM